MDNVKDRRLARSLNIAAVIVSIVVLILVGMMRRYKLDVEVDFGFLPQLHAILNGLAALLLILGFYWIRTGRIQWHKRAMISALVLSALFLLSYVTYHFTTPETIFGDIDGDGLLSAAEKEAAGPSRTVYLIILLSHIALAAISFPLILFTFIRAWTNQFTRHKRMARWVYPMWLYVAVTGPLVYLLLKPFYS